MRGRFTREVSLLTRKPVKKLSGFKEWATRRRCYMSHAKVFYLTDNKKGATIAGEVIEVTDRWVTIIPDDESVTKMLIPYSRGPIVEYCPHPDEAECRLTDKTIGQWCDYCSMRRTFVNDVCSSCGTKWLDQEGPKHRSADEAPVFPGYEAAGTGVAFRTWCGPCQGLKDFNEKDCCNNCGQKWKGFKG